LIPDLINNALIVIAASGVIGAYIDIRIGKKGRAAVQTRMEEWWLLMSYVKLTNLGKTEASLAAKWMTLLFGTFGSTKRVSIVVVLGAAYFIESWLSQYIYWWWMGATVDRIEADLPAYMMLSVFYSLLFSVGLSITIGVARVGSTLLTERGSVLNVIIILVALLAQYTLLFVSRSLAQTMKTIVDIWLTNLLDGRGVSLEAAQTAVANAVMYLEYGLVNDIVRFNILDEQGQLFSFLLFDLGVFMLRVGIMVTFLASYLLKPLASEISFWWRYLCESSLPIFTTIFTTAAAIAKLLQAVAKVASGSAGVG